MSQSPNNNTPPANPSLEDTHMGEANAPRAEPQPTNQNQPADAEQRHSNGNAWVPDDNDVQVTFVVFWSLGLIGET
ncbi:hypothetical protein O0I10_012293 [Lichtheimia ornata]|uniref:Uncharacterized protein n=1 Tax=Lichtheimia ornata TaxID=688661 RepID=A0AAD7XT75_9FUNG|nr:uncharacterized protein O0I10_013260 [Lichtheimia ornata]XP_058337017.1 uncharacterized protein O0I10_012293 [Lichtheimia ornata]KAJ8651258.1 hypothetical protein O0I10_013260 [Lichtheimia ornata]KAJ8652103.1 hypothetical protein O0I10_012293 [Lichtheimia ornata]